MSLRATERIMLPSARGFMPENAAAMREAHMQEVPDAESQLKLNTAAYFAGARTTGRMRRISLCRPGQGNATEARLRMAVNGGYPQARTKMTSKAYGIQASPIS